MGSINNDRNLRGSEPVIQAQENPEPKLSARNGTAPGQSSESSQRENAEGTQASEGDNSEDPSATTATEPPAPANTDNQATDTSQPDTGLRRSKRQRTPTERLIEIAYPVLIGEIYAYKVEDNCGDDPNPLLAYAASADPDTMYWHQAMNEPDKDKFIEAAETELKAHFDNGNFELVHKSTIPEGVKTLPAVWQMKRKRRIQTGEVYKWKARLNLDGSRMIKDQHYSESYSPVASWPAIRFIMSLALKEKWETRQIDYVLAFTQAEAECDELYMSIPRGYTMKNGENPKDYALHIKKNLYGGKSCRAYFL